MKDYFKKENEVGKEQEILSPSGKYRLLLRHYNTKPGCWAYSRGTVYRVSDNQEICDIKRNYGNFHYTWIIKNNQEWIISGRSYLNQIAVNLETGEHFENGDPDDAYAFCWAQCFISPDGNTLVVDGCHWACPYEYRFYDFTDPSKPWTELELDDMVDVMGGKDPVWINNDTVECFQCRKVYIPLNIAEWDIEIEELNKINDVDYDNEDNWTMREDVKTTLQRQGSKMVILSEELSEEEKESRKVQKEASEKWDAWYKDFKENNELYLTLKNQTNDLKIKWDNNVWFGGGWEDRRFVVHFRENRKWFHNIPLLSVFKIRSVDLEWAIDNRPIHVRLWDKTGHKYKDVEFDSTKDGMINALKLTKNHTKRFIWF